MLGQATNKAGGKDKLSNKYKPKQKIYNLERMKITALQGNVYVQHQLGNIYNYGLGVKIDFLEAFKWYKEAAMNGYVPAQTNLGMFYARGKGVEKNEEAAMYWYKKAADYGDSLAKKILLVKNKKDKTPEDTKNKRNKKRISRIKIT